MWRCHSPAYGATMFNPGDRGRGRFHPFDGKHGGRVSTLYAADTLSGALSETLFHNVPRTGVGSTLRTIRRGRLADYCRSLLRCRRPLRLIGLHGAAIGHLPITEAALIHSPASRYAETVRWARALYLASPEADGLVWRSRQDSDSFAVVLFGGRLQASDLVVDSAHNGEPLPLPPVDVDVYAAANAAGITITV
jgi:hypothetical protein